MELTSVPKTSLATGSQTASQQGASSNAQNVASGKPLIANSVPVPAETASPQTERRQDRLGAQQDDAVSALQAIESLRLTNRRTQLEFNAELNTVFLQIVDVRTEEVVETIPSEELVRQLKRKSSGQASTPLQQPNGGVVVDRSI